MTTTGLPHRKRRQPPAGSTKSPLRPLFRRVRATYRTMTASFRALPSALIIGTQKGGTTSLFNYLSLHPDVLPPVAKEPHYFDLYYARGPRWYRGCFPFEHQLRGGALTLEASPYYMSHPLAAERAAGLVPGAKLIALLRNPIDRAFSSYHFVKKGGEEPLSFAEAIDREPERLAGEEERLRTDPEYYSYNHRTYSYLRRGQYLEQLKRWVEHFPRSNLLVLQSEWLFRDPAGATAAVQEFLGLRRWQSPAYKPFLRGDYSGMSPDVRRRLVAYFEPYNRELYDWLGREFDWS